MIVPNQVNHWSSSLPYGSWDVLLKEKRNRTILMSTHFIEEADVLGDRIFIMAKGRPRCYGTPIYLKNIFGFGYQLRIAKDLEFNDSPDTRTNLHNLVRQFFQNATVMSENVGEIIYQLDQKDAIREGDSQSTFAEFFTKFEEVSGSLHINTFGVSAITLEDVFLKILYMSNKERNPHSKMQLEEEVRGELDALNFDKKSVQFTRGGCAIWLQKFRALLIKRLHHSKRFYPTIIFQLVIPFVMFYLIFTLDTYLRPNLQKKNDLLLNLHQLYGRTSGFFKDNLGDSQLFECYNKMAGRSSMNVERLGYGQNPNQYIAEKSQRDTLSKYSRSQLFGASVRQLVIPKNETAKITLLLDLEVWFNNEASHALPLSLSTVYNALFEYVNDLNVTGYNELKVINEPFPNPVALVNSWRIIKVSVFAIPISMGFDYYDYNHCNYN